VNDRAIRGYASAVYAAVDRFAGNQDGAEEHIVEALEVRFSGMSLAIIVLCFTVMLKEC